MTKQELLPLKEHSIDSPTDYLAVAAIDVFSFKY